MEIEVAQADLGDPGHARGLVEILDSYARDRMGGARRLPHAVRERLVPELAARTDALVLLAFADGRPVGAAVCFRDPAPTLFLEKRLLPAAGC